MSGSSRHFHSRQQDSLRMNSHLFSPLSFTFICHLTYFLPLVTFIFFLTPLPTHSFVLTRLNQSSVAVPSPYFAFGLTEFEVEGELVRAVPPDACKVISKDVAEGKLLWVEPGYCSIESKQR